MEPGWPPDDRERLESIIQEKEAIIKTVEQRLEQLEAEDEECTHRNLFQRVVTPTPEGFPLSAPPRVLDDTVYAVDLPHAAPNLRLSQSVMGPLMSNGIHHVTPSPLTPLYYRQNTRQPYNASVTSCPLPVYYPPAAAVAGPSRLTTPKKSRPASSRLSHRPETSLPSLQPVLHQPVMEQTLSQQPVPQRFVTQPVSRLSNARHRSHISRPKMNKSITSLPLSVPTHYQLRAFIVNMKDEAKDVLRRALPSPFEAELKLWGFDAIHQATESDLVSPTSLLTELSRFLNSCHPGDVVLIYLAGFGSRLSGGTYLPTPVSSGMTAADFNATIKSHLPQVQGSQLIAIFDFPYSENFLAHPWVLRPPKILPRNIHTRVTRTSDLRGTEGEVVRRQRVENDTALELELTDCRVASFALHFVSRSRLQQKIECNDDGIMGTLIAMSAWIQSRIDSVAQGRYDFSVLDFFRGFLLKYILDYVHDNMLDLESFRVCLPELSFNTQFRPFQVNFLSHYPLEELVVPPWNDAIYEEEDLARPVDENLPLSAPYIRLNSVHFEFLLPPALESRHPESAIGATGGDTSEGEAFFNFRSVSPLCSFVLQEQYSDDLYETVSSRENATPVCPVENKSYSIKSATCAPLNNVLQIHKRSKKEQDYIVEAYWRPSPRQNLFYKLGIGVVQFDTRHRAQQTQCAVQTTPVGAFVGLLVIAWERRD